MRTRFAPSPTGMLHVGNARAAVLNWLVTRRNMGQFLLRIEDTDVERNVETSESAIFADLDWLGITPDEGPVQGGDTGPYRQSERLATYSVVATELVERADGGEQGGQERDGGRVDPQPQLPATAGVRALPRDRCQKRDGGTGDGARAPGATPRRVAPARHAVGDRQGEQPVTPRSIPDGSRSFQA